MISMRHGKLVEIKNPTLRTLRNNLRAVWNKWYAALSKENMDAAIAGTLTSFDVEEWARFLGKVRSGSITHCTRCRSDYSDMVYSLPDESWYCVNCFEEEHFEYDPFKLKLTRRQVKSFLVKLASPIACNMSSGEGWKCGGKSYSFSRMILNRMGVSREDQDYFFKLCQSLGGYCDCEILMNAADELVRSIC